jgi:hypothetical protein
MPSFQKSGLVKKDRYLYLPPPSLSVQRFQSIMFTFEREELFEV